MKLVVHRRMEVLDIQHNVVRTIDNEKLSDENLSDLELDEKFQLLRKIVETLN